MSQGRPRRSPWQHEAPKSGPRAPQRDLEEVQSCPRERKRKSRDTQSRPTNHKTMSGQLVHTLCYRDDLFLNILCLLQCFGFAGSHMGFREKLWASSWQTLWRSPQSHVIGICSNISCMLHVPGFRSTSGRAPRFVSSKEYRRKLFSPNVLLRI